MSFLPNLPLGLRGKAGGGARVTAGPRRPHLGLCPYKKHPGTSLVVQWRRLCAPNTGVLGSIPGQGTRSHLPQLRLYTAK